MPMPSIFLPLQEVDDGLDALDKKRNGGGGIARSGECFLRGEVAVDIRESDCGLRGADIDTDDDAVFIEMEKRGAAAARQATGGAFDHPVFADELFDDE